jgi:predicted esterase
VAMAFRAAMLGRWPGSGIIAVGGDVPPELVADRSMRFPKVLLVRGIRDEWYTQATFDADVARLRSRGTGVEPMAFDGGHEWGPDPSTAVASFLASLQPS